MKKGIFLLSCIIILLQGCSSESDETNSASNCGSVNLTSVTQNGNTLIFNYQSQDVFNYYEIGYAVTANLNNGGENLYFNDSFTTTNTSSATIVEDDLTYYAEDNQTLSFYIRAQCSNGSLTNWQGPIVKNIEEYCETPNSFFVEQGTAYWDFDSYSTTASYFQVEYGTQGYVLGNGELLTTNSENTSDASLVAGNTYDFYVRAYCNNGLGFSSWIGPVSYYAEYDQNLCIPPSNVQYFIEYVSGNSAAVRFEWSYNGETQFEYVLVSNNDNPNNGIINTIDTYGWPVYTGLSTYLNYDFYVRGVCLDGTRTLWAGPLDVNP